MADVRNPLTVDLGLLREAVEERVKHGSDLPADEVPRAGLQELEQADAARHEWLVRLAEESIKDPAPSISAEQVFQRLSIARKQTEH